MQSQTMAQAGSNPDADAIRYAIRAATLRHDNTVTNVHLIATSGRSALAFGRGRFAIGTRVMLSLGDLELPALVGWSDGRRVRLDPDLGADPARWALLSGAAPGSLHPNAAANDAAPADRSGAAGAGSEEPDAAAA